MLSAINVHDCTFHKVMKYSSVTAQFLAAEHQIVWHALLSSPVLPGWQMRVR